MDKVFVDTDLILDLLAKRGVFYDPAAKLFSLADLGKIRIFVSSLSFANLHYILSKEFNANNSRKLLLKFKTLVTVLPVSDKTIELSLTSDFKDFEDGIQYFTATENSIKMILTRNLRDFKHATIPVMTPEQYLKLI
jgi:predicted nucleic acid-binding protein